MSWLFRKRCPESRPATAFKFPALPYKFPVLLQKFPVLLRREFHCKSLNLLVCSAIKIAPSGRIRRNSLLISLLVGNSGGGDWFDLDCVRHHQINGLVRSLQVVSALGKQRVSSSLFLGGALRHFGARQVPILCRPSNRIRRSVTHEVSPFAGVELQARARRSSSGPEPIRPP
jgi:hypothetical protein